MSENDFPSVTQIAKGRTALRDLKATSKLSKEGDAWLTFALDPFHDKSIKGITGIPDGNTGKSVVCSVVREINIGKPASGISTANWSCRITTYPVASDMNLNNGILHTNLLGQVDAGPNKIAPVVIDYADDNTPFGEFHSGADIISIPLDFLKGPFKIGAMGLEAVNTTSELHKQGLFSGARMNQICNETFSCTTVNAGASVSALTTGACYLVRTPPNTLADLTLLPDVCQWEAKEGAYSVVPLKGMGTRSAMANPRYPILTATDITAGVDENIEVAGPIITTSVIPDFPNTTAISHFTAFPGENPQDSVVWFFTGLSAETTLTIRGRWMIERYPNDQEPEIVVLSTPSAPYDPVALEIYSRVSQNMPAAVMFKENPEGEWWQRILGEMADVIGPMLIALPHPAAKAAGTAMLVGNKILNPESARKKAVMNNGQVSVQTRNKQKKKKKKQQKGAVASPQPIKA